MRRLLAAAVAALALLAPAAAQAHPLGNFSVNHLAEIRVSSDRIDVRYVLDGAEIPTFQHQVEAAKVRAEVARRLILTVDGAPTPLAVAGAITTAHPPGQGGLPTTRVVIPLVAHTQGTRVRLDDETWPGRVGWKAIVAQPGSDTATRSSAPAQDPTHELRSYPRDLLKSPSDLRTATLTVSPGNGTISAPGAQQIKTAAGSSGFADILGDGDKVLVLLLLAAFGWGAIHALSPGHGKAMVAAYLVGTRGRPKDAVALGAIVTATHTAGVFALGLITLALSQYVLPEHLYPYLNLLSGLLVVGVGASVLRRQLKRRHHHDHHHHDHELNRKSLLAMGTAAGVIPCPSALVVLLGAISQDKVALGMVLIVAFSAGLAATLSGLGLAVVYARRLPLPRGAMNALPAASAVAIVLVGCVLTAHALPTLT
jgi:ABC-type nickel/cobalt efflux system permease component RcnA